MQKLFLIVLIICTWLYGAPGFYVQGHKLLDANGKQFIIRGVNNPHIWWDSQSFTALNAIAWNKFNTVRIVWETKGSASRLDQIIARCVELEMIPMPELHDVTGNNSANELKRMAQYWARSDIKSVINKYKRYILLNIANEWGNNSLDDRNWREAYKEAITVIRDAGLEVTIVVDANKWGQGSECIISYGQELLNYDPQHNLLFDIHMYVRWNDTQKIEQDLATLRQLNLPVIFGEFGYNHNNGNNNLGCKVDHRKVMAECHKQEYGYLPWSWNGNNQENAWLDLSTDWNNLSWWGLQCVNDTYGIKNTSKKCSVFESSNLKMPMVLLKKQKLVMTKPFSVYTLSGRTLFRANDPSTLRNRLMNVPTGVYILRGQNQHHLIVSTHGTIKK